MMTDRRAILKAGLAGSLFLPLPYAWVWAQSEGAREGALRLLKAPKVALVVGNGKYKDAPELKNAPNDAKAVAEALKASGFAVTTLIDTGREKVEVPAGAFDCFRVEGRGQDIAPKGRVDLASVTWWAPERVRRPVAFEQTRKPQGGSTAPGGSVRAEMVAYKQN